MRKKINKSDKKNEVLNSDSESSDALLVQGKRKLTAEDSYFAERDKELIKKLQKQKEQKEKAKEKEKELEKRIKKCPDCDGEVLTEMKIHEIPVFKCKKCNGIWMEEGILRAILKKEANVVSTFMRLFQKKDK